MPRITGDVSGHVFSSFLRGPSVCLHVLAFGIFVWDLTLETSLSYSEQLMSSLIVCFQLKCETLPLTDFGPIDQSTSSLAKLCHVATQSRGTNKHFKVQPQYGIKSSPFQKMLHRKTRAIPSVSKARAVRMG